MKIKRYIILSGCLFLITALFFNIKTNGDYSGVEEDIALGNELGLKGNHTGAAKAFKNALIIDPYYIPAYLGLGTAYGKLNRNKEAIIVFQEGIKLDSNHYSVPQMQMNIASLLFYKMNDEKTAINYLKMALQSYTDQGDYAGVALAGQKLKQYKQVP